MIFIPKNWLKEELVADFSPAEVDEASHPPPTDVEDYPASSAVESMAAAPTPGSPTGNAISSRGALEHERDFLPRASAACYGARCPMRQVLHDEGLRQASCRYDACEAAEGVAPDNRECPS